MSSYFLHLGTHPELSAAEAAAVFGEGKQDGFFYFGEKTEFTPELFYRLGGSIRGGTYIGEVKVIDEVVQMIADDLKDKRRPEFVINVIGGGFTTKSVAIGVKKILRECSQSCRWVMSKESIASSVVVQKNGVLEKGGEYFVFTFPRVKDGSFPPVKVYRTLAVQDFELWSHLDYDRPARDARRGMLPPKVARMMVNIAVGRRDPAKMTLLDPHCGVGTVLQEALRLGVGKVIGSDIDARAVAETRRNLEWLGVELEIINDKLKNLDNVLRSQLSKVNCQKLGQWRVEVADAKKVGSIVENNTIDCIVTEPFLGKPQGVPPTSVAARTMGNELTADYRAAWAGMNSVLKKDGQVVWISPSWRCVGNQIVHTEWQPEGVQMLPGFPLAYSRPDAVVVRRIIAFTKNI